MRVQRPGESAVVFFSVREAEPVCHDELRVITTVGPLDGVAEREIVDSDADESVPLDILLTIGVSMDEHHVGASGDDKTRAATS